MSGRGHLCEHGLTERSENTGACLICHREQSKRWAKKNKDRRKEQSDKYYNSAAGRAKRAENKAKKAQRMRQWRADNKARLIQYDKDYAVSHREQILAKRKRYVDRKLATNATEWRQKVAAASRASWERLPIYVRASRNKLSKTNRLHRAPPWLTRTHKAQIQRYYELSAALTDILGERYVVDHVIPLQGELVSGLHVPWNLQVMTFFENGSKGNRIDL